jgi:hypothetical protein
MKWMSRDIFLTAKSAAKKMVCAAICVFAVFHNTPCAAESGATSDGLLKKIAILDILNTEQKPEIAYLEPSITSMVRAKLESRYSFRSMTEGEMRAAVDESGVNRNTTASFDGALAVGTASSQDFVIAGGYVTRQSGAETIVSMRFLVIDVRRKTVMHEFTAESAVDYRLWDTIDRSASQIADALSLYQPRPEAVGKISLRGASVYANAGTRFRFAARDDIAVDRIIYGIDGGEEKIYTGELPSGSEGPHVIRYYAVDKAGNRENSKYYHYTVDLTPPESVVRISSPVITSGGKTYISGHAVVSIDAADSSSGVANVRYSLNGKDFIPYAAGFIIAEGEDVNLRVRVEDKVGNASTVFALVRKTGDRVIADAFQLTVDATAPAVTIVPQSPFVIIDGKNVAPRGAVFAVNAEDAGSGVSAVYVRIDGRGDFMPYNVPLAFSTPGAHFIEAKSADRTGNESGVTVLPFQIDAIPPRTTVEEKD